MISVAVRGGLGNQMFTYAAAVATAERLGTDIRILSAETGAQRPYCLDRLAVPQTNVTRDTRWRRRSRKLLNRLGVGRSYFETAFHYESRFASIADGTTLEGYFLSWRYFDNAAERVRQEFKLATPLSPQSARYAQDIEAARNSVAIHVRRGDKLTVGAVLDAHYYRRAIDLVTALSGDARFFVFSDDLEWAIQNLGSKIDAVPVSGNDDAPWQDMMLMSLCQHHIIANSSFSWWGAWLGANDTITVAPRRWRSDAGMRSISIADLYMPDWYLV